MKKFFFFLFFKQKLTFANLLSIILSFIFAILLKQLYIHYLNVVPVIGELQTIDISYLSLIIFFKSISNILIEFLLSDKQVDYAVVCNGIYKSEAANILLDNVG